MRALFPAPRRCRAPGSAASPTRRTGAGGVFPEPPAAGGGGLEVRAPTQAPPPRGQPLGARRGDRRSPSRARLPTLSLERRRRPYSPFPIGLRGGLNPLSPADGGALRKGGGAVLPRPRLRPPGSPQSPASPVGQAWAGRDPFYSPRAIVRVRFAAQGRSACSLCPKSELRAVSPPSSLFSFDATCPFSEKCPYSGRRGLTARPKSRVVFAPATSRCCHPAYKSPMFL